LWTQPKGLCGDVEKGRKNQRFDGNRGTEMACGKVSQTTGRDDAMSTQGTMPVPQKPQCEDSTKATPQGKAAEGFTAPQSR
jgi:hypothetical protein